MLRLHQQGHTQREIAEALGLHHTSVAIHLRKLLGIETPAWAGRGRVAIPAVARLRAPPATVAYPKNPPRLEFPCERYPGEAAKFWAHVTPPNENGCRLWLLSLNEHGYGQVAFVAGQNERSNRVSWRLTYGPIPDGEQVNHKCDVRPCVEPEHFWLGTQAENMQDKAAKGRAYTGQGRKGEDNVTAVMTWPKVREMKALRAERGLTYDELSAMFGISKAQVSNIITGKQWKEEPVPL